MGQHDNYGFALAAQPGGSQGRPTTNTSSQLNVYERPAHPKCSPVPLSRMVEPYTTYSVRRGAPVPIMPVTNAIENINAQLRKIIKTRGHFPSNEAAIKLLWFVLRNITGKWGSSTYDWKALMNQFASIREERFIHPHR